MTKIRATDIIENADTEAIKAHLPTPPEPVETVDENAVDENAAEFPEGSDVDVEHDWVRPRPLEVLGKNPGSSYRWIRTNRLDQALMEGWSPTDRKSVTQPNYPSGVPKPTGSKMKFKELILCEMPRARAEARNRFYQRKTEAQTKAIERNLQKDAGGDTTIYGKIEEKEIRRK